MSYESTRAKLDSIIADFRKGRAELSDNPAQVAVVRRVAIHAIVKLGYTEGDAIRWLK